MSDYDGSPLPSLQEFWDKYHKVVYSAIRNTEQGHHQDVMDRITDCFALRWKEFKRNYHPGLGVPFSGYVMQNVKRYVIKHYTQPVKAYRPMSSLPEAFDAPEEERPSCLSFNEAVYTQAEIWLAHQLAAGHTLKALEEVSDEYNYMALRALKRSLKEKMADDQNWENYDD